MLLTNLQIVRIIKKTGYNWRISETGADGV